jgi:hypothetical protein
MPAHRPTAPLRLEIIRGTASLLELAAPVHATAIEAARNEVNFGSRPYFADV